MMTRMLHNSMLALELSYFRVDSMLIQILIMLQLVVSRVIIPMRRPVVLLKSWKFLSLTCSYFLISHEVESREEPVVRNHVVSGVWLLVVEVGEGGHVSCAEVEGDEGVSVVDCVQIFPVEVLQNIMLDDAGLGLSCIGGSGCWDVCAWAESKDVLVFLVLKSVRIHVN